MSITQNWVTVADADLYFATRLGADKHWASGTAKEAALQTAYNDLQACGEFTFEVASGDDLPSGENAMPEWQTALCEQALFLLSDTGIDTRQSLIAQGVLQAGIVKESYNKLTAHTSPNGIIIAPKAKALLSEYLSTAAATELAATGTFPVER